MRGIGNRPTFGPKPFLIFLRALDLGGTNVREKLSVKADKRH